MIQTGDDAFFCTCKDVSCPNHPLNHDKGCTLCIKKNLDAGEIPSCFFNRIGGTEGKTSFTYTAFRNAVNDWETICNKNEGGNEMEQLTLMQERYSLRKYDGRPVEKEKLEKILEAARCAPSARNFQGYKIYVIESPEAMEKAKALTASHFGCPVILVFCACEKIAAKVPERSWEQVDTTLAAAQVMLEAHSLGLGTCMIGKVDHAGFHAAFDIPDDEDILYFMTLGYKTEDAVPSERHFARKPLEEIVTFR